MNMTLRKGLARWALASPAVRFARWISPKFVVDRHVGWIALLLLVTLWVALAVLKQIVGSVEVG